MKDNNEMADFDLSKITGREPPLVTDDERDAEIAYLSDVVANRDRELAALRARVAELEAALRLTRCVLPARDSLPKTQTLVGDVVEAVEKALGISGNKGEQRNE